ncbi:hypothetical protein AB0C76_11075 [Kitasatospora sp. NPDC048722]|uniref:hypothetical protein n=1 Tax=Kitasatospora sp. NPDC048722 TaxID=3155639 RepID=UPI0033E58BA0
MRTTRTATAAFTALLCLGALSACGPDNGGQDAAKTTAPAPASTAAPATGSTTAATPADGATGTSTGNRIPAKAWMDARSVPLDDTLHWAPLAANASPVPRPVVFKGMELCHAQVAKDDTSTFTGSAAAKATVGFGGEHWTAQQTLLFEGDPTHSSGTKQLTNLAEEHLTAAVKDCAKTAPNATVKVTAPGGADVPYFAAAVTVPQPDGTVVTLHEYVVVAGGTVSELSVWATAKAGAQPKEAWTAPDDKYVATGMTAPLCEALPGC